MNQARVRAPELPETLEWFNTERPLRLAELRGKVVLLDFWTYCCINCIHILPDLRYLEDKYGDSLCVIGVHSPKFPNERVGEQVRKAIQRYHIRHPVAHDPRFRVWRTYGIRAWPSVLFIDPDGYVVGVLPGEGRRRQLDAMIQEHLEAAERRGAVSYDPLPLRREPGHLGPLTFPGKVAAAGGPGRRPRDRGGLLRPAGAGRGRRLRLRGRSRQPRDPAHRPHQRRGPHRGRHGPAGEGARGRVLRSAPGAAQLAVGRGPSRRRPLHRHGRPAPDLAAGARPGDHRGAGGLGARGHRGRAGRPGELRPAVGARGGHGVAVRGRQRELGRAPGALFGWARRDLGRRRAVRVRRP